MPNQNTQQLSSAPAMVRMANGSYYPASQASKALLGSKKFLIILQYYAGDQEAAEELGALIADLERVRNRNTDILIFRRFDAPEFSFGVRSKLQDKFEKVYFETCRRRDAKGYPFAPNQMWSDIVTLMGQVPQWRDKYFAFLPLETDCVPVHPNWINELIEEFRLARSKDFAAVGHIHNDPVEHLNGVAVYDVNLWKIVGGNRLNGSDPQVAFDIYHRRDLLPISYNTPLIMFEYQRPTITADDLFKPWKDGFEPALFHGVKDGSARAAVRAKYVSFSPERDASKTTVFTYQHQMPSSETVKAKYRLWYDAWKSRGWNPVVLRLRDAAKNPRYAAISAHIEKLPFAMEHSEAVARLVRWIALDSVGGGFMVDPEVLPGSFSPAHLSRTPSLFHTGSITSVPAAQFDRASLSKILDAMGTLCRGEKDVFLAPEVDVLQASGLDYTLEAKVAGCGQEGWREAAMVEFNQSAMLKAGVKGTPIQHMEKFLQET